MREQTRRRCRPKKKTHVDWLRQAPTLPTVCENQSAVPLYVGVVALAAGVEPDIIEAKLIGSVPLATVRSTA